MTEEAQLRENIVRLSKSLFDRGFSVGSAGNISALCDKDLLITPTNSCLGFLDPARIAKLDSAGNHVSGDAPSKEIFLHRAFYETRPMARAVVHLHSTYAVALSASLEIDPSDCIPPITPYVAMCVGQVPLLAYFRPGDPHAARLIRELGGQYAAVLLANHGSLTSGADLTSAVYAAEELEETAKLIVILRGAKIRTLSHDQVEDLHRAFGRP
jgi:3-dehydro-4-phosphotetronate decarboxylase